MRYRFNTYPLVALLAFLMLSLVTSAQTGGYKIGIEIKGIPDTTAYLAFYMGDKIYIQDTARVNDGVMTFEHKTDTLKGGMYIIAGQKSNKYLEFLVNENTHFSLRTSIDDLSGEMKAKNSRENKLFYTYIDFLNKQQKIMAPIRTMLGNPDIAEDSLAWAREQSALATKKVEQYRDELIAENQGTFFATFIKSTIAPDIPELPTLPDGSPDSSKLWYLYKSSFWDNYDLTDEKLLRTPEFSRKVDSYFDDVVFQHPDSLAQDIDELIEKSKPAIDTYKYLIWYLTLKYERSQIMGFDAVFVHMAKTYYESGIDTWTNATVVQNIIDRANTLEPLLLGKTAPPLILLDTSGVLRSLHDVKARYTIVFFWDTDCGHCKKEVPVLKEFYKNYKEIYDLEIYGVCCDTSFTTMKKYMLEKQLDWINVNGYYSASGDFHDTYDIYSTPVMYLLNEEKEIIAKRLLTKELQMFIERLEQKAQ